MSVRELEKRVRNLTPGELSNFSEWFDHYRGGPAPVARGRATRKRKFFADVMNS